MVEVLESGPAAAQSFRERFDAANRHFSDGRLDEAETGYLELLRTDSRSPALLCKLAELSLKRRRTPQAVRYYDRAQALKPGFPWTYVGLANVLAAEGATEDAIKLLRLALECEPTPSGVAAKIAELENRAALAPPPRVIVVDGAEDLEGRALFVLAALGRAAAALPRTLVRVVGGDSDSVRAAADRLSFDHGLSVEHVAPGSDFLTSATLVVAVYMSRFDPAAPALADAERRGVPQLVAVQFPNAGHPPAIVAAARAAHDPRAFARLIVERLGMDVTRV